jgi:hypothetical protein
MIGSRSIRFSAENTRIAEESPDLGATCGFVTEKRLVRNSHEKHLRAGHE